MILLRRLLKAHVRAYDRVSKTGALSHIREHEDTRVRSYARKILGSKDSYDLHTIRKDRFGHLPHWNKLDDHTRQAILDAEEEKAKSHKEFENWKEKAHGKKKDAVKVDHSDWQQGLMFKSRRVQHVAYILRKSDVRGSHHTNKRGTQWNSVGYTDRRVKHNKKPKGQSKLDRGGKTINQHIVGLLATRPVLHAESITGKGWKEIIHNAKRWYMDNAYRKPIYAPAFGENVQFEARSLVYAATKAKDVKNGVPKGEQEVARRMALLPKAVEVLKQVDSIDQHDIREVLPPHSNSKKHVRFGLYGRFDDGMVINVVVEEIQQEGKKLLSVFDFDRLEGDKFNKFLELTSTGLAVRPKQQTPGSDLLVPIKTISPPENKLNKSLYLVVSQFEILSFCFYRPSLYPRLILSHAYGINMISVLTATKSWIFGSYYCRHSRIIGKGETMYSAKAIANEFIKRAKKDHCGDLSPMKLQKLIYFAHGWYLANVHKPLISEVIQAWKYGPVISSIYHDFKQYGTEHIDELEHSIKYVDGHFNRITPVIGKDDGDALEIIDLVWEVYGEFSPIQLSNMTHAAGTPWSIVTQKYPSIPSDLEIPNELIEECFSKELEEVSVASS